MQHVCRQPDRVDCELQSVVVKSQNYLVTVLLCQPLSCREASAVMTTLLSVIHSGDCHSLTYKHHHKQHKHIFRFFLEKGGHVLGNMALFQTEMPEWNKRWTNHYDKMYFAPTFHEPSAIQTCSTNPLVVVPVALVPHCLFLFGAICWQPSWFDASH